MRTIIILLLFIFRFTAVSAQVQVFEGQDSEWVEMAIPKIETEVKITGEGYIQEISIPWSSIGKKPDSNSQIGFNTELIERGNPGYSEMISATEINSPYTWSSLKL